MAGRTMDVSVLVRLVDKLTGPLNALSRKFAQFSALGQRIGVLGAAVAAISFAAPLAQAAAFDQKLRDIVVTAGYFGQGAETRIKELGKSYQDLALKVGIASSDLMEAGGNMIASGLDEKVVDKLMPTIGRVAKAASAIPLDVAKTAFALNNTLKIGADQMEAQMAKLIVAGKLGRFEFKDMARELPEIANQFAKFGVTGQKAVATIGASLQIAMFGTDSSSAAATNFKNYLTKINAPEAVTKFRKAHVDIVGVMQNAAARGMDPIEASYKQVLKLAGLSEKEMLRIFHANKGKGKTDAQATAEALEQIKKIGGAANLTKLFGDMQVLDFILPMLANAERYKEFKKEIENAGLDVIARDYQTQWIGLSTQMTIAGELMSQLATRVGLAFGKNLPVLNEWGVGALAWVDKIDKAYPGAIDMVLQFGGAFLIGVTALAAAAPVMAILSAAFGTLAAIIGVILSPVGAVIAALAALAAIGYVIYKNWAAFGPAFGQMWDGIKTVAGGAVAFLKALFSGDWSGMKAGLATMGSGVKTFFSGWLGYMRAWGAVLGPALSQAWNAVDAALGGWPSKMAATATDMGTRFVEAIRNAFNAGLATAMDWAATGMEIGAKIVEGIENAFNALWDWAKGIPGRIAAAIGSIDLSNIIKMPSLPSWLGGGSPAPAAPSASAPASPPASSPPSGAKHAWAPAAQGFRQTSVARAETKVGGVITVAAAPGAQIQSVRSDNPSVPIAINRGLVVGRA